MCDQEVEIKRRIERARDGESSLSYEDVKNKSYERYDQFQVTILPEKYKFDLELWSIEDYTFKITKDYLNIF
ncbi:MAG: hypothetical protein IPN60_08710 [Saprospiraceae bacterium]|nr:hypothetical protein [Candidatus Opimibacter skivensis]